MEKILFADDERDLRELIKVALEKEGFTVITANDGRETLELARENKPDLIILDYMMPGLDGIEACKALKKEKETAGIPVIMVTGYPDQKERSLAAGAIDFITKPVDKTDLLLRIRSVLRVRYIKNELQKIIAYIAELENKGQEP